MGFQIEDLGIRIRFQDLGSGLRAGDPVDVWSFPKKRGPQDNTSINQIYFLKSIPNFWEILIPKPYIPVENPCNPVKGTRDI